MQAATKHSGDVAKRLGLFWPSFSVTDRAHAHSRLARIIDPGLPAGSGHGPGTMATRVLTMA